MTWSPFNPEIPLDEAPIIEQKVYDGAILDDLFRSPSLKTPGTSTSGPTESWCIESMYVCISQHIADAIYAGSLVAKVACEIIPRKAFTLFQGWSHTQKETPEWLVNASTQFIRKVIPAARDAGILARQYGDAYVILFWDDGEPDTPFNPAAATKLLGAYAKSRCTLTPEDGYTPETATFFLHTSTELDKNRVEVEIDEARGVPRYQGYERFHKSRIIHIPGLEASKDIKAYRGGYNFSIFDYLDRPLREWVTAKYASIDMLKTHSPFVYKLKHLAMKSLRKQFGSLWNRFRTILDGMRYMGGLVVDKDQEDASFLNRSYSGVDKLFSAIDSFMSSSSDVPQPYLLDKESAFSEDNLSARYEMAGILSDYCISHINPLAEKFLTQYAAVYAPELKEDDLLTFTPRYSSGLELTRMEQAEIFFKNAQADVLYLSPQVLNIETVRSRFRDNTYHDDMILTGDFASSKDIQESQQVNPHEVASLAASSKPGKNSSPAKNVEGGGTKKSRPKSSN